MRVLGVDPGNAVTGFGIVDRGGRLTYIAAGTIRAGATRGPARLASIYEQLIRVIDAHAPDAVSLERSFVALNIHSAFKLGEARAMVMLAAAHRGLELFEYTPTDVKLSIAGYGRADKRQVKEMVQRTIGAGVPDDLAEDATDALAISLCHLFRAKMPRPAPPPRRKSMSRRPLHPALAGSRP
ncbi:MAG TPA: crossover junction endodeoxyribonuclease RuvC [Candidatus Binataceae bacterium]|jgi:crossover junction endodeoxyribonuclease RuvC|nr:crossover junction endodeoxyribonuclease RuvC [Candidatus Binataceae bacterium]